VIAWPRVTMGFKAWRGDSVTWPVRSGGVPSLDDGLSARAQTAADLGAALVAGGRLVLVPLRVAGEGPGSWLESCGKTQLAVFVAELLWRLRKVELLVWVVATSRTSVLSGYVEAAREAMGAGPGDDGEAVAARFVRWLGETSRPWLVVLDDLSDTADMERLWPAGPAGRVVITTANPAAFSAEHGTLIQPVGTLSAEEALSYLTSRLSESREKLPGAADQAEAPRYEPLALAQAGAVMASSTLSCRDYLDRYERNRALASDAADREPPAASVTWALSAEHADRLAPDGAAGRLLSLSALLDGHGFPASIFATQPARGFLAPPDSARPADQDHADGALLAAERAGLLSVNTTGTQRLVRMSAIVQAAARAAMPAEMLDRAALAAADALLQVWPADERPIWLVSALRSCAAGLWQATGDALWANGCPPVLQRAGQSLDQLRLTGPAVTYWTELAAASDRILGPGHPDTLAVCQRLGGTCLAAGRAKEAVSWFQRVLIERVRVLGPDHPSAITARRELGHALAAAGQFDDSIAALQRVVGDFERVRPADHPDTLGARDELAAACRAGGRYADAIRLGGQTLADRERAQGPEHPGTMATRRQLADACLADGRPKEALAHYKRVLADAEREFGPHHQDTIAVRASLGAAYHAGGRTASAIQLYEEAQLGYRQALGPDDPTTLASSASLAGIYHAAGRVTDAVTLLSDTLARCERTLPAGDPMTLAVRKSLADMAGG